MNFVVTDETLNGLFQDKAYDEDPHAATLTQWFIDSMAPHRNNRNVHTRDSRPLRCYQLGSFVERSNGRLQN
jgi:hypothetical protein